MALAASDTTHSAISEDPMKLLLTLSRLLPALVFALSCMVAHAQDQAPDVVKAALKKADDSVAAIVAIPDAKRTFENTVLAFDDMQTRLEDDTSMFLFMQYVS